MLSKSIHASELVPEDVNLLKAANVQDVSRIFQSIFDLANLLLIKKIKKQLFECHFCYSSVTILINLVYYYMINRHT